MKKLRKWIYSYDGKIRVLYIEEESKKLNGIRNISK